MNKVVWVCVKVTHWGDVVEVDKVFARRAEADQWVHENEEAARKLDGYLLVVYKKVAIPD